MDEWTNADGRTVYVDPEEAENGSKGPFCVVYTSDAGKSKWGYFCSHCESLETAMDSMGRIECTDCRNLHKAEEWDAAHE